MPESARLALIHWRNNANWWDIVLGIPKNRKGATRPFRDTVGWLERNGLAVAIEQARDRRGCRPPHLYRLTRAGHVKRLAIMQNRNA